MTRLVYDTLGRRMMTITGYEAQGASDPADWLWDSADGRWEASGGNAIDHGSADNRNVITMTVYDLAGRVTATRDPLGHETRYAYDALGRRVQTITNYVDGVFSALLPDEDLIETTTYNKAGQVVSMTDARGTQTAFSYDAAGRRLTVTRAVETSWTVASYTSYDKAGRVLRAIDH